MRLRDRAPSVLLTAPFRSKNWRAARSCLRTVDRPGAFLWRYLTNSGTYPHRVTIRTPVGPVRLTLFSRHDLLTVNEVFCRRDYGDGVGLATVVDVGANIGIAAMWFLSRSPNCFVHCLEPDERNARRLEENLAPFAGRFRLIRAAVGCEAGTGRYGHLVTDAPSARPGELAGGTVAQVEVVAIADLLDEVLGASGSIDLLKVDTEGSEEELIDAIPPRIRSEVRRVVYEMPGRVVDSAARPRVGRRFVAPVRTWLTRTGVVARAVTRHARRPR